MGIIPDNRINFKTKVLFAALAAIIIMVGFFRTPGRRQISVFWDRENCYKIQGEVICPFSFPVETPFIGRRTVALSELVTELRKQAKRLEQTPIMQVEYEQFTKIFTIEPSRENYEQFVIVKMLFECTRDSGLWHISWEETHLPPKSDEIWRQWTENNNINYNTDLTAIAECDEIAALYAFLCGKLGVRGVGLYWPTYHHSIAAWNVKNRDNVIKRVLIPTSYVYFANRGYFGRTGYKPVMFDTIYEYIREDVDDELQISAELAQFMVVQPQKYCTSSEITLHRLKTIRESVWNEKYSKETALKVTKSFMAECRSKPGIKDDIAALGQFKQDFLGNRDRKF
jgi:hypothetical protein